MAVELSSIQREIDSLLNTVNKDDDNEKHEALDDVFNTLDVLHQKKEELIRTGQGRNSWLLKTFFFMLPDSLFM